MLKRESSLAHELFIEAPTSVCVWRLVYKLTSQAVCKVTQAKFGDRQPLSLYQTVCSNKKLLNKWTDNSSPRTINVASCVSEALNRAAKRESSLAHELFMNTYEKYLWKIQWEGLKSLGGA